MAVPADRVQAIKRESAAGGGDAAEDVDYLTPLDPTEDALEAQGLFVQPPGGPRDETTYVTRDGSGNMLLRDQIGGTELRLSQLALHALLIVTTEGGVVYGTNGELVLKGAV